MNALPTDNEHVSTVDGGTIQKIDYDTRRINTPEGRSGSSPPLKHEIKCIITKQNHIAAIYGKDCLGNINISTISFKIRYKKAQKLRLRNQGNTPLITLF